MGDKTNTIFFALFFIGILCIVAGNILDYYLAGSIIGIVFNVIGFLLWVILIIYKFIVEKKK